jgi:hypothetical protein
MNTTLSTIVVGALLGCATSQGMQDNVRRRAAFDLNCPQDQLQVVEIESPANTNLGALGSWGVRGCGRQATYVQDRPKSTTVVMNSPIRDDPSNK